MRPQRPPRTPGALTPTRAAPRLPGFALSRPLHGTVGPPWRARDSVTGFDVVLRPLATAALGTAAAREMPDHPHLLVPRVVSGSDGALYTAVRHMPNGGLDALLARRVTLSPGEAGTVLVAVGRALAALHAAGTVHGGVTASAVVLDAGVRPMLDGSRSREADGRSAADDIGALGSLALDLVGGEDELVGVTALRDCLLDATDPDPAARPAAADLVRRVMACAPPEPLRLTSSGAMAPSARPAARRPARLEPRVPRPLVLGLTGIVALVLAVALGAVWAHTDASAEVASGPAESAPEPVDVAPTSAMPPDWMSVLADLDAARGAAFANADTVALASADADGSPALAADSSLVRQMAAHGWQARGYRVHVVAVRVASASATQAWIDVTDHRDPYWLVAADGSVVGRQPERADAQWLVHLVRSAGGWRVHDVRSEPQP